jgi:hypothetical protein
MNSHLSTKNVKGLFAILLLAALAACGGGGGGDTTGNLAPAPSDSGPTDPVPIGETACPNTQTVVLTASSQPVLRITEVAAKARNDGAEGGWFEVFNASTVSANLSDYRIVSTAYSTTTSSLTTATFSLPSMVLPAGGYVVLASKALHFLSDGPQLKYVGTPGLYPSWNASGYIELQRASDKTTVDFVRFGTSTVAPTTPTAWTGTAAPALPNGTATGAVSSAYGQAMVRLATANYADTDSAADWVTVNFSTPGGKNDIAAGVIDSDVDGIPDSAKLNCNTYAGLDLFAMGARPGGRDIFLEVQVMDQNPGTTTVDLGVVPRKEALQKVVNAFAAKGIRLHIDIGSRFSPTFDPANFNLGGGNAPGAIPFSLCTDLPIRSSDVVRPQCSNFFQHKNSNFDVRRRVIFSYNLFANSQLTTGLNGSSGFAEIRGNDSMITMGGGWGFTTTATATLTAEQSTLRYINMQASTLMHEFGHNLGLRHGGFENLPNFKPNYVSVMNYMYQLSGLPGVQNDSSVGDRYGYYVANLAGGPGQSACTLSNSRCSTSFIIDYSNGTSTDLDENALVGANLIGRGTPVAGSFINWSGTATVASPAYAFNVNRDFTDATPTVAVLSVLKDHNDWTKIQVPFVRTMSGFNSGSSLDGSVKRPDASSPPRRDPMNDATDKEFVREDPPSPQLLRDEGLPGLKVRN